MPAPDRVIVARALAKNPDHRFASCLEFVRALKSDGSATPKSGSDSEVVVADAAALAGDTTTMAPRFGDTTKLPRPAAKPVLPDGILPDWRFLACISNSPLMEVWKAQTPAGTKKRVKLLYGLGCPMSPNLKKCSIGSRASSIRRSIGHRWSSSSRAG